MVVVTLKRGCLGVLDPTPKLLDCCDRGFWWSSDCLKGEIQHSCRGENIISWCSLHLIGHGLRGILEQLQLRHQKGQGSSQDEWEDMDKPQQMTQPGRSIPRFAINFSATLRPALCYPVSDDVWLLVGPRDAYPGGCSATGFGEAGQVGQARVSGFHFHCMAGMCRGGCKTHSSLHVCGLLASFRPDCH